MQKTKTNKKHTHMLVKNQLQRLLVSCEEFELTVHVTDKWLFKS